MWLDKAMVAASFPVIATMQLTGNVLAADDAVVLEEVIVTATKREQSLLEVPMSVSVLSEGNLERINADRFEDYVGQVPGLSMNPNGGNTAKFSIRGITTSSSQSNTQAPVAIYHDELPVLNSFAPFVTPDLRLFDVKRVEVLRGPQGTLFGSGAMGGAIRVITNKPGLDQNAGKAVATFSTTEGGEPSYALSAMANIPLVKEELALRVVAYYRKDGGYVDNITRDESNADSQESLGGRVMLKWAPTEGLSILATVSGQKDRPQDRSFTFVDGPVDQNDTLVAEPAQLDFVTANLVVDYDLGTAVFTSSSTFSTRNENLRNDVTLGFQPFIAPLGINSAVLSQLEGDTKFYAQEVRLASQDDGSFQWLVGVFLLGADRHSVESTSANGADSILTMFNIPTAGAGYPVDSIFGSIIDIQTTEKAVFGEATYHVSEQLSATFGLRWFSNSQDLKATTGGFLAAGIPDTDREKTENAITPKFSISFRPNEEVNIYAQAAKGYRVGQNNFTLPVIPGIPATPEEYNADSLWNYEIGLKASLLGGRLNFETAAFYIDWQDIQLQQRNMLGFNFINNAGEASSKGIEFSLNYLATENVTFGTSVTYNETELKSVEDGVNALKGDRLPGTPKFKISNFVQLMFDWSSDVSGFVRIDHNYSSSAFIALNNLMSPKTDSYNMLNVNVGADFGEWSVDIFAKNLTNNHRIVNIIMGAGRLSAVRMRPLQLGVSLRTSF